MKLLITGAFRCTEEQLNIIKDIGFQVDFLADEKKAPENCDKYEAIICNGLFLHNDIGKFPELKFVQLTSAGYDRVPMEDIKKRNIVLRNAGGVYSIPMAEFALCGVLQLFKDSRLFSENQKKYIWEKNRNIRELFNKKVLIVGCGSIGTACAKRFSAFGCNVVGVDIETAQKDGYSEIYPMDRLDDLLATSDVVLLALPLLDETRGLFNKDKFEKIKAGAVFVNISRGQIINTDDLVYALENKLGGAVLDVFENEPLEENSPLWDMPNVIVTPHNSFVGDGNGERLFELITQNLKEFKESVRE